MLKLYVALIFLTVFGRCQDQSNEIESEPYYDQVYALDAVQQNLARSTRNHLYYAGIFNYTIPGIDISEMRHLTPIHLYYVGKTNPNFWHEFHPKTAPGLYVLILKNGTIVTKDIDNTPRMRAFSKTAAFADNILSISLRSGYDLMQVVFDYVTSTILNPMSFSFDRLMEYVAKFMSLLRHSIRHKLLRSYLIDY